MVAIADALFVLFPSADRARDYMVSDDGTGQRIAYWNTDRLGPQPTAEQLAAVTSEQVAAAQTVKRRQDAGLAAAKAADGVSIANRAAETVGGARDNNIAETLKALCDVLGVTTQRLAEQIAANRLVVPPTSFAQPPADTVASATVRLSSEQINTLVGTYIAIGAGDPA